MHDLDGHFDPILTRGEQGSYKEHQLITEETYGRIQELEDLAPLLKKTP
jgi:acetate kinase